MSSRFAMTNSIVDSATIRCASRAPNRPPHSVVLMHISTVEESRPTCCAYIAV